MTEEQVQQLIKDYITKNLTVQVDAEPMEEQDYGNTNAYIKCSVRVYLDKQCIATDES